MCRPDTEVIAVDPERPDEAAIGAAAGRLRAGGLVAFPTETVYGLGASALDPEAVARVFRVKGRPADDPLIVHLASGSDLGRVAVDPPATARELAAAFWPGPLTLILRRHPDVAPLVSAGLATVAVRVPRHPVALALLRAAGVPVVAPSANRFSRPSPTRASHVLDDLGGQVDVLLDGGRTPIGIESTVLDLTAAVPTVLRPGAVPVEALRRLLPHVAVRAVGPATGGPSPSPGQSLRHYAPAAELFVFLGPSREAAVAVQDAARTLAAQGRRVGILAPDEDAAAIDAPGAIVARLGPRGDAAAVAAALFDAMRALDRERVDVILARDGGSTAGLGLAVRDRLVRAAEGRVVQVDPAPDAR